MTIQNRLQKEKMLNVQTFPNLNLCFLMYLIKISKTITYYFYGSSLVWCDCEHWAFHADSANIFTHRLPLWTYSQSLVYHPPAWTVRASCTLCRRNTAVCTWSKTRSSANPCLCSNPGKCKSRRPSCLCSPIWRTRKSTAMKQHALVNIRILCIIFRSLNDNFSRLEVYPMRFRLLRTGPDQTAVRYSYLINHNGLVRRSVYSVPKYSNRSNYLTN